MKKLLASLMLILAAYGVQAADRVTASVTINSAAANDNTFIVNGVTRTWKTSVTVPATQILVGATANEANTNLVNHLLSTPFSRVTVYQTGAATLRLDADTGVALVLGGVGGYYTVTYSTQTVATAYDVIVPYTAFPSVRRQTITEGLVDWLNLTSGKAVFENSTSVSNLVGLTNAQTVAGIKQFTNASGIWKGYVSNSPAISGYIDTLTNGTIRAPVIITPIISGNLEITNGSIYGDASGISNATAALISNEPWSTIKYPDGGNGVEYAFRPVTGSSTYDLTMSTNGGLSLPGPLELRTGVIYGNGFGVTNWNGNFPNGNDVTFERYSLASLANGNNAAVPVGTNVFVEVSGPSGAFNINGIAGGRNGKMIILLNLTTQNMTIVHDSGVDPTAANRIYTLTGSDVATTGNGAALLIYNANSSRWILLFSQP